MTVQPVFTELDACMEQLAIAEKRARDAERKLHRLERQMAGVDEDSPDAKDVRELLDLWWRRVKQSNPNVAHGLDSTRAAKVRSTLKRRRRMARDQGAGGDYGMLMCRKAILGVTCDDWAMGRNPKSGGKAFNDIAEHILNTDHDVEKFAALFDERFSHLTMEPLPAPVVQELRQARETRDRTVRRNRDRYDSAVRGDPVETILTALSARGCRWRCTPKGGWEAQCPAHEGTDLNLKIDWNGAGDRLLVTCWSRHCEVPYVMDALGLPLSALFVHRKEAA